MKVYFSFGLGTALACEAASGVHSDLDPTTGSNKMSFSGGSSIESSFNKDFYRACVDNIYAPLSSGFLAHRGPSETETTRTNFGLAMFLSMNASRIPGDTSGETGELAAKCVSVHCFTHILWDYFAYERGQDGRELNDMDFDDNDVEWRYYDGIINPTIGSHSSWYDFYPFYRWNLGNGDGHSDEGMNMCANPSDPWGKNTEAMSKWKGYDGKVRDYSKRESRTCDQCNWYNDCLYRSVRKVSPYWTSPTGEKAFETKALEGPGTIIAALAEHVVAHAYLTTTSDLGASIAHDAAKWLRLVQVSVATGSSKDLQAGDIELTVPIQIKKGRGASAQDGAVLEANFTEEAPRNFVISPEVGSSKRYMSWSPMGAPESDHQDWSVTISGAIPRAEYAVSYTGRLAEKPAILNNHLLGAAFMVMNHICLLGFEDGINDDGPGGWGDTGPSYVESPIGEPGGAVYYWTSFNINLWLGPAAWAHYVGSVIGLDIFHSGYDDSNFLTFTSTLTTAPWAQFYAVSLEQFASDEEDVELDSTKLAERAIADQLNGGSDE